MSKCPRLGVTNDELVSVRDAMRGLHKMVEQLEGGERHQFVLMHRGRMVARVVPLQELPDPLDDSSPPGYGVLPAQGPGIDA